MLTGLRLGNFKAFGETQNIPIKPLTLIFGANSAGKSSIIHGLLLAHHANETGNLDVHQPLLGGEAVDLGGFAMFVHRRDSSHVVKIGFQIQVDQVFGSNQRNPQSNPISVQVEIGSRDKNHKAGLSQLVDIQRYTIEINKNYFACIGRAKNGRLRLIEYNYNHPLLIQALEPIITDDNYYDFEAEEVIESHVTVLGADQLTQEMLKLSLDNLAQNLTFEAKPSFSLRLTKDWEERRLRMKELLFPDFNQGSIFLPFEEDQSPEEESAVREKAAYNLVRYRLVKLLDQTLQAVSEIVSSELNQATYLGPLRSYPPRLITFSGSRASNLFSGKDDAWRIVGRDAPIREEVNKWMGAGWLKTPYTFTIRQYVSTDTPTVSIEELVLLDKRFNIVVSHRDIGVGISQVLPVLVSAYGSKNTIVAIEQPEIHLHPALQAELGDVFIESALGERKNTFLLETHSEHLILRIMRRMRDTVRGTLPEGMPPVRPEDVAILYVDRKDDDSTSVVSVLELDEEGQLLDPWPGGFFEEGFNERFA